MENNSLVAKGVKYVSHARLKVLGVPELVSVDVGSGTNTVVINGNEVNMNDIQFDTPITGTVFGTLINFKGVLE